MFKLKPNKAPSVDTLVDAKTRIHGDVEFCGGLRVEGYIGGDVLGAAGIDSVLWLGEQGAIEGSVRATSVILNGLVNGDIDATDRVEMGEKARVMGNVSYNVIETAVGAQINGKLIHKTRPAGGRLEAAADGTGDDAGQAESRVL